VHFLEGSIETQQADRGLKNLLFGEGHCAGTVVGRRIVARLDCLVPMISAIVERAQAEGRLRRDVGVTDLAVIQVMLHSVGGFTAAVEPELWRRQLGLLLDGLRADRRETVALPLRPLSVGELQSLCAPGR
jgi:hypothetical protein